MSKQWINCAFLGFGAGIGFMLAQEIWWAFTGLVGLCHG